MRYLPLLMLLVATPALAAPNLDYDFWANTPLAHVVQGGVVADAASPGFVKYLRDNRRKWTLSVEDQGRKVALAPGRRARLWLPVGPEQKGKTLELELMLRPNGSQSFGAFVGGKQVADEKLTGTWQTVRYKVPRKATAPGLVEVRLLFRKSRWLGKVRTPAAIRYVRLVEASSPKLPEDETALAAALATRTGDAVRLAKGGGLDYYITPAKGLRLSGKASGGKVEVLAQLDGGGPAWIAGGKQFSVGLGRYAGRAVRLMLRARGGDVMLRKAKLGGGRTTATRLPGKPKYVVFWLIDALRADKLDFYGKMGAKRPKVKTPNLSVIAATGAVFDPFWVNSNESKASHASYWTGAYPDVHKVVTHKAKLASRHLTLAEAFKAAGYRTQGFISNGYISKRWNYTQGFDKVRNFIREEKPNDAGYIVNNALPWIRKNKGKSFYLYLGTADPHVTYRAHKGFIKQYDPKPYNGPYRRFLAGKSLERIKTEKRRVSRRNRQRIEALYENEIAFNDKHFGRLVAELKKQGMYKDTLIIISSDHGEEFWEHGSCGHGHSLYQELVRVPMVLHWGGVIEKGTVATGHDGTDLLPTLLDILGKKTPDEIQGESLMPYLKAKNGYPRAMIATKELTMYAVQIDNTKVILRGTDSLRVYDLAKDPREKKNLFGKATVLTLAGLDALSLFMPRAKTWNKTRWGVPNNLKKAFVTDQK